MMTEHEVRHTNQLALRQQRVQLHLQCEEQRGGQLLSER
jgi:hypothetical protein